MKKTLRVLALAASLGALIFGGAFAAFGAQTLTGQWCDEGEAGWWYKLDYEGNQFLANTWYWIQDEDGVIRCYYFDYNGWLLKDTTVDGEPVDADGRWVDASGNVITKNPEEVEFALSTRFTAPETASAAAQDAAGETKSSSGNSTRVSGGGDVPVETAVDYQASAISGTTVTNSWAGYTMNLPAAPTQGQESDGADWFISGSETENIYSNFYKLSFFGDGNNNIESFAQNVLSSSKAKKILKGDTAESVEQVTINGLTFYKVKKGSFHPEGTKYNYAFIRQIPGTDYVHVISFETVDGTDYSSYMDTYSPI